LFVIYGACFGIELTINNIAALYFTDYFGLALGSAGAMAAAFGLMNLFARTLGGLSGDWFGAKWGLRGRVTWLFMALFCEGLALMFFSQMTTLAIALPALIVFSLFVQMSEGATYSVVPFINKKALGAVAGIVGAGGNAGAVAAGFLFKGSLEWPLALLILGTVVTASSFLAFTVRFSAAAETDAKHELDAAVAAASGPPQFQPQPALGV
jgi:NNP family nitrate/nitrite transporter-like MFS transporter